MWFINNIIKIWILIFFCFITSCSDKRKEEINLKQEIINVEKEFETMANEKSIADAFQFFADQNAVILRNNKIIKGQNNIYLSIINNNIYKNATLKWEPDFVEISKDGSLAYTFGNYIFEYYDDNNLKQTSTGIFHTVWKKQDDGSWKFVWD